MKNNSSLRIQFLGGASTVTGSKTLVEVGNWRILIDCGLFQGLKQLRLLNREPFPVNPASVDAIILTHAHLDHCGYIPLIVKSGFTGAIHCTAPTLDLTGIILKDSGKIQVEDAHHANLNRYTKHDKAIPLYTQEDAEVAMQQFIPHNTDEWVGIDDTLKFRFLNNGHILGSAFVELQAGEKRFLFSGDMGRTDPLLMYPPVNVFSTDYLILESTYGDRLHPEEDAKTVLLDIIKSTFRKNGILMIPTFAVERAQEIIYLLYRLKIEKKLPNIPIYLDSPMGINSSNVFEAYPIWQIIPNDQINSMYDIVKFIMNFEHSKMVVADNKPKIVLAGSGMLEGGRILHYLNNHINDEKNTLLFVGYQAAGTRGHSILNGAGEIKYYGSYHKIKCRVRVISSMSAHADQQEIITWLRHFKEEPERIFLNHGDPHAIDALRVKINNVLGWDCQIPRMHSVYHLVKAPETAEN